MAATVERRDGLTAEQFAFRHAPEQRARTLVDHFVNLANLTGVSEGKAKEIQRLFELVEQNRFAASYVVTDPGYAAIRFAIDQGLCLGAKAIMSHPEAAVEAMKHEEVATIKRPLTSPGSTSMDGNDTLGDLAGRMLEEFRSGIPIDRRWQILTKTKRN